MFFVLSSLPLKVKSETITHSNKRKGESFLVFSSHSLPLGHVSYCHHLSSVVCRPSVNISHFNQPLRNHRANCNQTLVELSLDGPLPKLCPVIPTTKMSSNFNCSYMARSSLTYISGFSVKFFFQPIYTDYAN